MELLESRDGGSSGRPHVLARLLHIPFGLAAASLLVCCGSEPSPAAPDRPASTVDGSPEAPDAAAPRDGVDVSSDAGSTSDAPDASPGCRSTPVLDAITTPSPHGLDFIYDLQGNTHVVYVAGTTGVAFHAVRPAGAQAFSTPTAVTSSTPQVEVSLAIVDRVLRAMVTSNRGSTLLMDRTGSAWTQVNGLAGNETSSLRGAVSAVDADGGYHAATIFKIGGALYFKHLWPGSGDWGLPTLIAPDVAEASISIAKDGSMVVGYATDDGSTYAYQQTKVGPSGNKTLNPSGGRVVSLAVVADGAEMAMLYGSTGWSFLRGTTTESVKPSKVASGAPRLDLGADGVFRGIVYEPTGSARATAHLVDRRNGRWRTLASRTLVSARVHPTPSGGSAMLVRGDRPSPQEDDLELVECDGP